MSGYGEAIESDSPPFTLGEEWSAVRLTGSIVGRAGATGGRMSAGWRWR